MGASQIPAASSAASIASDNWVSISSVTPTSGATTVSFTSITGYKKLLLKIISPTTAAYTTYNVTFNSDTGANYSYGSLDYNLSGNPVVGYTLSTNGNNIPLGGSNSGTEQGVVIINEANTTGMKTISGFFKYSSGNYQATPNFTGQYFGSATISTVTLSLGFSTFTAGGTISLYGVAQ